MKSKAMAIINIIIFVVVCINLVNGEREILTPTKEGEDVGIVIIAGAGLYYDQYILLGRFLFLPTVLKSWLVAS